MRKSRRAIWVAGLLWLLPVGIACQDFTTGSPKVTSSSAGTVYQEQNVHWSRRPRVAVMEFQNKSGIYHQTQVRRGTVTSGDPLGHGMEEQMVTALTQTGAFIVLERQALGDVMVEQDLGQTGRFKRETTAEIGELEGAEMLIYGAVTEYHPSQASIDAGGGIDPIAGVVGARSVPGAVGVLAEKAIAGFFDQDHVALDIRIVDATTGRIVNSTSVEATPRDFGGEIGGVFGTTLLKGGGSYSTPIQKTVRAAMIKAVNFVADNALREGYLKRGAEAPQQAAPAAAPSSAPSGGNSVMRNAQAQLNGLGYQCGVADGLMGGATRACLQSFQKDEGIPTSGRLDAATRERLSALGN
jgi:curli biogenesis system outer membrane secretion channel CsgG